MSFRIDDNILETMELIIEKNPEFKKSEIIRDALHFWLMKEFYSINNPEGQIILINRNVLALLFESVDYSCIQQLVDMTMVNHKYGFEEETSRIPKQLLSNYFSHFKTIEGKLYVLKNYIYGKDGFGHLESFEYSILDNVLTIEFTHHLGRNYGIYITSLLEHHINEFGFFLDGETMNFSRSQQETIQTVIFRKTQNS